MEYGIPTLLSLPSPEAHVALCRELGLNYVELNMSFPTYGLKSLQGVDLLGLSQAYGVGFTLHLDEGLNITEFHDGVREAYVQLVLDTIALAKASHIKKLNMHLHRGVWCTLPQEKVYLNKVYRERYLAHLKDFRTRCEVAIGGADVTICIENTSGYLPHEWEGIDLLLESHCFALTLDTGHAMAHPEDMREILLRKDRLAHMHLHDARGTCDHLPLGAGDGDIPYLISLAKEKGLSPLLEVKTEEALRETVAYLKNKGFFKAEA